MFENDIEFLTGTKDGNKLFYRRCLHHPKKEQKWKSLSYGSSQRSQILESRSRLRGPSGWFPDGPTVNLERVSHMIEELEEVDNNFMGRRF